MHVLHKSLFFSLLLLLLLFNCLFHSLMHSTLCQPWLYWKCFMLFYNYICVCCRDNLKDFLYRLMMAAFNGCTLPAPPSSILSRRWTSTWQIDGQSWNWLSRLSWGKKKAFWWSFLKNAWMLQCDHVLPAHINGWIIIPWPQCSSGKLLVSPGNLSSFTAHGA